MVALARFGATMCLLLAVPSEVSAAQGTTAPGRQGAVRAFVDCDWCDEAFLRTEIRFVDYVRDRKDADLHILVTLQGTGGGGTEYTFKFIGLGRFADVEQTLTEHVPQTATSDERRRAVAEVLKRGLVRYVAETPLASRLKIAYSVPEGETAKDSSKKDPWNYWTFRASTGGSFSGERSNKGRSLRGSLSANRTTSAWKTEISTDASYRENTFELSETETFTSVSRNVEGSARIVKSLDEHWSAAAIASYTSSTFLNYDHRTRFAGGVEYDVFPYSQSTRRLLTIQYTLGHSAFDYEQETVFFKTAERLVDHRVVSSLNMRQPWGSVYVDVSFSQYLGKPDKHNISGFGAAEVRLFKGLSFNVFSSISRPRDQIYLPRAGATAEEILVRQRQLATGHRYSLNFRVSYSFGSIYNNVVNPRFGGGDFFFF